MNEKFRFQKQWEEYRRRRNRQYIAVVIGMLLPSLLYFSLLKSGTASNTATFFLSFSSIFSAIVVFGVVLHFHKWICPNCGKQFFVRSFWVRVPERLSNCVNCNLPKYSGSTFEKS